MTSQSPRHPDMNTLPFQQFQRQLLASVRDPHGRGAPRGVPARRLRVYRALLYNKIEASLAACFPISRQLLGRRRWTRLVKAFIAEHRCVRPCYRQIPDEFVLYLEARGLADDEPLCLLELAHHEWMELVLMIAEAKAPADIDEDGDLLEFAPVPAPVLNLSCYGFPVPDIRPDRPGWTGWNKRALEEGAQPTFVLGLRDPNDVVRFIGLNAVTAALIQRVIEQGQPPAYSGRAILSQLAAELSHPDPERFLSYGADILNDLRQRGAVAGVIRLRISSK